MKTLLAKLGLINLNSLFLSVGYILFHIGREDKLIKENRKSLRILKVSSFIWNLFKIYKLEVICSQSSSFFFFFGLTDIQFSSVAQSCPTLCDPKIRSMPGLPVHHQLPEFTQTHVHRVSDAIQPSHPLASPSPPAPNPSQHQRLFQWVNSSNEVAKVLEFQL